MATSDSSEPNSQVTSLDFAVTIDGTLVQVPETLNLQTITATKPGEVPIPIALQELTELEKVLPQTQAEVDRLRLMVDPGLPSQLEHKQTRLSHLQNVLNSLHYEIKHKRVARLMRERKKLTYRSIETLRKRTNRLDSFWRMCI